MNKLYVIALANDTTIKLQSKRTYHTVEYSYDEVNWQTMLVGNISGLTYGTRIYLRGIVSQDGSLSSRTNIRIGGSGAKIKGNVNVLLDYTAQNLGADFQMRPYMAFGLFEQSSGLTDASELLLPSQNLAQGCYWGMFHTDRNLTLPPEILPATTLAVSCYENMFESCGFDTAPIIAATTLAIGNNFSGMFQYNSHLVNVVCLAETGTVAGNWLQSCGINGTLYKSPNADASLFSGKLPAGWSIVDYVDPNHIEPEPIEPEPDPDEPAEYSEYYWEGYGAGQSDNEYGDSSNPYDSENEPDEYNDWDAGYAQGWNDIHSEPEQEPDEPVEEPEE